MSSSSTGSRCSAHGDGRGPRDRQSPERRPRLLRVDPAGPGERGKSEGRGWKDPVRRGEDRGDRSALLPACASARSIPGTVRPRGGDSRDPPFLAVRPRARQRDPYSRFWKSLRESCTPTGGISGWRSSRSCSTQRRPCRRRAGNFPCECPPTPPVGIHGRRPGARDSAGFEEKVFEVGFTTRNGPLHTGMGLPVARHLVEERGGGAHRVPGGAVARPRSGCR